MRKYNKRVYVGTAEWWQKRTRYEAETGCVLYTGFANSQGYCLAHNRAAGGRNTKILVHRLAYEQVYGPIAPGLNVCHRCDRPTCCNPEHLFLGTQKDNLRDMFAKGRARPRGRTTPPLTVFPAVSGRVASKKSHASVNVRDTIHLIGPVESLQESLGAPEPASDAVGSRWYHVTGVPEHRPTQALVKYERPLSWTERDAAGVKNGVEMSCYCADQRGSAE
jgi:hypothetical protein